MLLIKYYISLFSEKRYVPEPETMFKESDFLPSTRAIGFNWVIVLSILSALIVFSDIPKFVQDFRAQHPPANKTK